MARYSSKNDWRLISEEEIVRLYPQETVIGNIKTYSGTLVDKVGEAEYDGGALKVIIEVPPTLKKSKTFKGETAWMDAERWSNDIVQDYKSSNILDTLLVS